MDILKKTSQILSYDNISSVNSFWDKDRSLLNKQTDNVTLPNCVYSSSKSEIGIDGRFNKIPYICTQ